MVCGFCRNSRKQIMTMTTPLSSMVHPGLTASTWEGHRLWLLPLRIGDHVKSFSDPLVIEYLLCPENIPKDLKKFFHCQCGECLLVTSGSCRKTAQVGPRTLGAKVLIPRGIRAALRAIEREVEARLSRVIMEIASYVVPKRVSGTSGVLEDTLKDFKRWDNLDL